MAPESISVYVSGELDDSWLNSMSLHSTEVPDPLLV